MILLPGMPPGAWETFCPMRALKDPAARDLLLLHAGCRREGLPPRRGAFEDQDARTMDAFAVIEASLALPPEPVPHGH